MSSLTADQALHDSLNKQIGEWENRIENPRGLSKNEIESIARTRDELMHQTFILESKMDTYNNQLSYIHLRIEELHNEADSVRETLTDIETQLPDLVSQQDELNSKENALRNEGDNTGFMLNDVLNKEAKLSSLVAEAEIKSKDAHKQVTKARNAHRSLMMRLNRL